MMQPERYPAHAEETMTAEQRDVLAEVLAGPRKGAPGPFKAMLRSPGLMRHAHKLGAYVRFESAIPPRLKRACHPAHREKVVSAVRVVCSCPPGSGS